MKSNGPHPSRDGHHPRAAIVYGILQTALTLGVCYLFFDLDLSNANYWGALLILAVCSVSLVGFGVVAAVLDAGHRRGALEQHLAAPDHGRGLRTGKLKRSG